jgi:ribosomal protein S12 methylthiotransferase
MPLQHADDGILRAMKRERSASALSRILERVRRRVPDVTLRTSFIVGFPGETDAAFARLTEFVEREQFDRLGVFTYSQEENTAAAAMPAQVPARVKHARRRRLMETQAEISMRKNQALVGRNMEVIVEGQLAGSATRLRGRTSAQAPDIDGMMILRGDATPGEIVHARIDQARTYDLVGQIIGASV